MRCENLTDTWRQLRSWFDLHNVLVLPPLHAEQSLQVRLDADLDDDRTAGPAELGLVVGRLQALVRRFGIRAVYADEVGVDPREHMAAHSESSPELAIVTIRTVAGGVVHELMLLAAWYAEFLDRTVGCELAPISSVPRAPSGNAW